MSATAIFTPLLPCASIDTEETPNCALLPAPAHTNGNSRLAAKWYGPMPKSCCRPRAYPQPALTVVEALLVEAGAIPVMAMTT